MSTQYKNSEDVPTSVLVERLRELAKSVAKNDFSDFSMRFSAELDRDADLVLSEAANRLSSVFNDIIELRGFLSEWDCYVPDYFADKHGLKLDRQIADAIVKKYCKQKDLECNK